MFMFHFSSPIPGKRGEQIKKMLKKSGYFPDVIVSAKPQLGSITIFPLTSLDSAHKLVREY